MGLFDFFRRKPKRDRVGPDLRALSGLPEPRMAHYALVHYALREFALANPLSFYGIAATQQTDFVQELLEQVWPPMGDSGPGFTAAEVTLREAEIDGFPVAVVEMPTPRSPTEAYFAALVVLARPGQMPDVDPMPSRYFTLEFGIALGGPPRTVLCEWTADGTHHNFGDGPPPRLDAFLKSVRKIVATRS